MNTKAILVAPADPKDRQRRKREVLLAVGAFFLVMVLTWVELRFLGVDSFLFVGLFNVNLILLLIILFLVIRNTVKLMLERKRRVLGARLRTRLVLAFVFLSLFPTVLMFLISIKFVKTSVDYWFKSQVENSMTQALEVGRAFYKTAQQGLERKGKLIVIRVREMEVAWGGKAMDDFLNQKRLEHDLSLVGVITPEGSEQNWHGEREWDKAWPEIKSKIDWEQLRERPEYWSALWPGEKVDLVVGLVPVDDGKTGYLIVGERIGKGLLYKLDQIVKGIEEYKKLKSMKYPIRTLFYLVLGAMTLLIILGGMWFGFRLAKEISAPVQALALGTQRIAEGDLDVRLEDQSTDELGFLVQSFNKMAEDLGHSQDHLTLANTQLADQNQELESRGRYMAAVLNNITAGVISLDNEGRINTVNKAAEAMLDIDSREVIGTDPQILVPVPYREMFKDMLVQLSKGPRSRWQRQMDVRLRDRDLKLFINAVVLRDSEGGYAGMVMVFEDYTELEKMQRMAAWREVARRIAHEIKNPLTPIKLSAQRLEQKFGSKVGDKVFSECTALIVRQVEHLQAMVQEFSAFAKLPEVVLKEDHLAPLLQELVTLFRTGHTGIEWSLEFESEIPAAQFDLESIRRVLMNILTNAVEALDGKVDGQVWVTARHDKTLRRIQVSVADNGPGLTAEERSRIFEPYYSKKKGGTGLGLAIVRSVLSDHHGYARVEANLPQGTVFIIEIPA